jgi:hypothetical protein
MRHIHPSSVIAALIGSAAVSLLVVLAVMLLVD